MTKSSSNRVSNASTFSTQVVRPSGPPFGPTTSFRGGAGAGAFLLAILTAGALVHVGVRLKGLEVAYDLGRERRIATELEEQRRRLHIEIGMLKDPRRVVTIARDRLNMGPPNPDAIRRLGAGGLWQDPAPSPLSTPAKTPASAHNRHDKTPRSQQSASTGKPPP